MNRHDEQTNAECPIEPYANDRIKKSIEFGHSTTEIDKIRRHSVAVSTRS